MVSYKLFNLPEEWDNATKLSFLQRRVIVYSIQYYMMDATVISDQQYDACARQLEALTKECTQEEREKSRYWYCMSNFTAATGFDLYSKLTDEDREYLSHIADIVLDDYRHGRGIKASRDTQGI